MAETPIGEGSRVGYGYRESSSPLISLVWWAEVDEDRDYTDATTELWGLAFGIDAGGRAVAELVGPSTRPREMRLRAGERFWGLELHAHVFVRGLDAKPLDEIRSLETDGEWVTLGDIRFPFPDRDGLESLVDALERQGILLADEHVRIALAGGDPAYSDRSMRRMTRAATGLGKKDIEGIRRARTAYALLQAGSTPAEAAVAAGYADQPHMIRSFRLLAGETPGAILRARSPFDSRPEATS